jgi:hypothetical protein
MTRTERDFKGIWIPAEVWLSPTLSLMEKVLFVEIHSLDNERGCYASNKYFAQFFGLSDRQIRRYLLSLKEKGLIQITILNDTDRVIRVVGKYRRVKPEQLRDLRQMKEALVHQFTIGKFSTSRPGRADRNVHGGRK